VERIYEWLKADQPIQRGDGAGGGEGGSEGDGGRGEGVELELVSMGKNLIGMLDQTIEEAGLRNGTVMVEIVGGTD